MRRWAPLLLILGSAGACAAGACAAPAERFEFACPAMGTEFRVVLYAESRSAAQDAAEDAFACIRSLDEALSDYASDSELVRLGKSSDAAAPSPWVALSPELCAVLEESLELSRRSAGAFDVTAGPFTQLWRRARRRGELPDPGRLSEAARAVGFAKLELDSRCARARLHARGMRLDLGGIAKGLALDRALAALARHGSERALVVGGGELRAGAPPPGARGWRVTLVGLGTPAESLELVRAALATSGDLEQALELGGVRHSHILDPRSGAALTERRLVSVLGPLALRTDALATALSVLGPEEGLALLRHYPGYEARVLVERRGGIEERRSAGFPRGLSCRPDRARAELAPSSPRSAQSP